MDSWMCSPVTLANTAHPTEFGFESYSPHFTSSLVHDRYKLDALSGRREMCKNNSTDSRASSVGSLSTRGSIESEVTSVSTSSPSSVILYRSPLGKVDNAISTSAPASISPSTSNAPIVAQATDARHSPVVSADRPTSAYRPEPGLHCPFEGCPSRFTQQKDLNKHLKKHKGPYLRCGCCKRTAIDEDKEYYRMDKLSDHMRSQHGLKEGKLKPVPYFAVGIGPLFFASSRCLVAYAMRTNSNDFAEVKTKYSLSDAIYTQANCTCDQQAVSLKIKHHLYFGDGAPQKKRKTQQLACSQSSSSLLYGTQYGLEPSVLDTEQRQWFANNLWAPNTLANEYSANMYEGQIANPGALDYIGANFNDMWQASPVYNNPLDGCATKYREELERELERQVLVGNVTSYTSAAGEAPGEGSIPNIEPADFIAMQLHEGFGDFENILKYCPSSIFWVNLICIGYHAKTRTLKIRGTAYLISFVEQLLKESFASLSEISGTKLLQRARIEKSHASSPSFCQTSSQQSRPVKKRNKQRVFALGQRNRSTLFTAWTCHLTPKLSDLLSDRIGPTYTTNLVLYGSTKDEAEPCIQITSPTRLALSTRRLIREDVSDLCLQCALDPLPITFRVGHLSLLAGDADAQEFGDYDDEGEDGEDEGDAQCDLLLLRYSYNQPWAPPGMGAAIGSSCSDRSVGTLGGYIEIKGVIYILIAAHLLKNAWENRIDGTTKRERDLITSPARCDIKESMSTLEAQLEDERNCVEYLLRDFKREIQPHEIHHDKYVKHTEASEQLTTTINRLKNGDYPTTIAQFAQQRNGFRDSQSSYRVGIRNLKPVKMDWAVCEVTGASGFNVHRYPTNQTAQRANAFPSRPTGYELPPICDGTCDPEGEAAVHYVGQNRGRREGTVSGLPILVSDNDVKQSCWFMLEDGRISTEDNTKGDSGAWIIRTRDNKVMGQLLCWLDGKLLFTPINDVIDDIKEAFDTDDVKIPRHSRRPDSIVAKTGPIAICCNDGPLKPGDRLKKRGLAKLIKLTKPRTCRLSTGDIKIRRPLCTSLFEVSASVISDKYLENIPQLALSPAITNHWLHMILSGAAMVPIAKQVSSILPKISRASESASSSVAQLEIYHESRAAVSKRFPTETVHLVTRREAAHRPYGLPNKSDTLASNNIILVPDFHNAGKAKDETDVGRSLYTTYQAIKSRFINASPEPPSSAQRKLYDQSTNSLAPLDLWRTAVPRVLTI